MRRPVLMLCLAAALAACGTYRAEEIQGNNTGGLIPPGLAKGNVLAQANAHCAKYGRTAKITFTQEQVSGGVVFVCVGPDASTQPAASQPPPPMPPAKKGAR